MSIQSIEARNLSFSYGLKPLISNLSFKISSPCTHITSAANGAGKSTLLKLLCGGLSPSSGDLLFNGTSVAGYSFEEWKTYRRSIGYSFDFGGLLSNRTLFENLALPLLYHNVMSNEEIEKKVDEYLLKFDLMDQKNLRPSEVSGSQRKATCVVRSILMDPEVLLLDDPTTGLKSSMKSALFEELERVMEFGKIRFLIFTSDDGDMSERFPAQQIICKNLTETGKAS